MLYNAFRRSLIYRSVLNAGMRNIGGFRIFFLSIPQIMAHGKYFDPHLFILTFLFFGCFSIFHLLEASFCLFCCLSVLVNNKIYLIKKMLLKFGKDFKKTFLSKPTLCGKKKLNNINFTCVLSILL